MTQPITIGGFERKFANDSDPWGTFINCSEAKKRDAIRYALGTGKVGRTLELASGNGSNSAMLSRLSQRLISCDGSPTATELTAAQLAPYPHSTALCRSLPGAVPSGVFDRIVAAEILYYFSLRDMNKLAKTLLHTLRPGGQLILAHHHLKFDDASQPRMVSMTGL